MILRQNTVSTTFSLLLSYNTLKLLKYTSQLHRMHFNLAFSDDLLIIKLKLYIIKKDTYGSCVTSLVAHTSYWGYIMAMYVRNGTNLVHLLKVVSATI